MTTRTRILALLVLVGLLVTAGCVGVLTGDEPLTFDAASVSVAEDARQSAGYEEVRVEPDTVTREFTVAGQNREVEVTNHVAEYSRSVDLGPAGSGEFARFAVFSTPQVELASRTFNPVGEMSNRELVEQVQGQYHGLRNVQPAGERTRSVLGASRTVSTFTADAEVAGGQSVELLFHVSKFEHGEDFVVVVAVHPSALDGEVDRVDTMLGGVQHASG